jgi:mannitol 2-dehydrogenase
LAHQKDISHAALVVAAWARFVEGVDGQGEPIPVVDRLLDVLRPLAERQRENPAALITDTDLFGDLVINDVFVSGVSSALRELHAEGARAVVARLVRQEGS